jgi:hypothetical protein
VGVDMWKVSEMITTDNGLYFTLVDVSDDQHFIEVDKVTYQTLDEIGLIQKDG